MRVRDRLVSSPSLPFSKKTCRAKHCFMSQDESHERTKMFQVIITLYCQTTSQDTTDQKLRFYYGGSKYCRISVESGHAVEKCAFVAQEVQSVIQKQTETKPAIILPVKCSALFRRGSQSYYGRRQNDYYPTPAY